MATDDERRRVAEALRGMHDYETAIPIVRTCLGLRRGEIMDPEVRRRMSDRIADLIDPDTTSDTTKTAEDTTKTAEDTTKAPNSRPNCGTRKASASQVPKCDREALLALARWLDARATDLLKTNSIDHSRRRTSARREHAMDLMTACGLIREACGEVA